MTDREDILRMVRDAREQTMKELPPNTFDLDLFHERFFKLAYEAGAAAEREKVARWMRERGYATGHGDTTEDLLGELRTQEREACLDCIRPNATPMEIAAAIRARGNK